MKKKEFWPPTAGEWILSDELKKIILSDNREGKVEDGFVIIDSLEIILDKLNVQFKLKNGGKTMLSMDTRTEVFWGENLTLCGLEARFKLRIE
jgi:hypothetical protein